MANYAFKACALILGSALFFPVSCTGALFAGTYICIELDARDLTKGERAHHRCYVIASTPETNGALVPISLSYIDPSLYGISEVCGEEFAGVDTREYSFLLPNSQGEFREGQWGRITYDVTFLSPREQLIEVYYSDDDVRAIFRYIAEENKIKPLYSKLAAPSHMFGAMPYAWIFALLLYLIGRRLRKICGKMETNPEQ